MDLALNNPQTLICHKTQQTKPNQTKPNFLKKSAIRSPKMFDIFAVQWAVKDWGHYQTKVYSLNKNQGGP